MINLKERPAARMKLVGGRLCLDFVNTVGGWEPKPGREGNDPFAMIVRADKLVDYLDLAAWGQHSGMLSESEAQVLARIARRREREAAAILKRAFALRGAIYGISVAIINRMEARSADLAVVNRELSIAHGHVRLHEGRKNFVWEWINSKNSLDQLLWRIADSTAEMLTTDDLGRLRECPGDRCGWLFLDTSKNSRRQWCDMQTCGNLAKVRRFRQRQ